MVLASAPPAPPPPLAAEHEPPPTLTGARGYPLPLPTRRAVTALCLCALPVALGVFAPALAWAGCAAALCVIAALFYDFLALPSPAAFTARREDKPVLALGRDERLAVEIAATLRGGGVVRVRVRDDLAPDFRRVREPAPARLGDHDPVVFTSVAAPQRRGRVDLGDVTVRVGSRLGLAEREVKFAGRSGVRVYPGLRGISDAARMLRRGLQLEAGLRRTRRRGEGSAFESLREYVRGEDPRRIDWKATARRGKLISRHYEVERSQNVMLLIDCGRWMTGEAGGLSRLDEVLNAALLLTHVSALRDDRIGVLAFSDKIEAFVPPTKGREAVERVMEAVFDLEPKLVESDYAAAFAYLASRHRKRSLLVLFTDVLGPEPSRTLVTEVRRASRRHLPLVLTLRDSDVDAETLSVPQDAQSAYRQAAAEELLHERAHALALMQQGGAQVLDCTPSRLGVAAVERYMDIKARMLL